MSSERSRRDDLNASNGGWSRSDFSDRYYTPYANGHISRSLSELDKKADPTNEDRRYEKLSPVGILHPNGKYHPSQMVYDRNYSSQSDTTIVADTDATHPTRSLSDILSRFAERTSCVGPPYINSSKHFYSKFCWSVIFVGMVVATVINVYLNVATFNGRPVKTTVTIGYSSLTFPMVTVCNSNAVRKSALNLASEDLREFVDLHNPGHLERQPGPQPPEGGQNTGQTTGGQNPGQNTGGQNPGQNTGGQSPGSNTGPGRRKRFVDKYQQQQKAGNRTFRPPKKDVGDHLGGQSDTRFESQEQYRYVLGQESETTRYRMSHQIDDMLLSCSMEGRSCEVGNFTSFLSDDYGACYSFNQVQFGVNDVKTLRKSYRRGNDYGLQLIFFLEVDEFIQGLTLGYGARVSVSYPTTMPFPGVDGLFVESGSELDIGVKMINISRLPQPYGVCADPQSFAVSYGFAYTRQACQSVCPHTLVLAYCNCFEPENRRYYPLNTTETHLACNTTDYECVYNVQYMYSIEAKLTCDCPNPCLETTYDLKISSRQWPEDTYMYALLDAICRRPEGSTVCQTMLMKPPVEQRRNFLKLNVFYRDLNYETLQEEADYPESQFLSDLGGSIGLWVGLSVMSMAEVLELVGAILVWLIRKCLRCGKKSKSRNNTGNGHNGHNGNTVPVTNGSKAPGVDGVAAPPHPHHPDQHNQVVFRPEGPRR